VIERLSFSHEPPEEWGTRQRVMTVMTIASGCRAVRTGTSTQTMKTPADGDQCHPQKALPDNPEHHGFPQPHESA
jgi:hypothetical protein